MNPFVYSSRPCYVLILLPVCLPSFLPSISSPFSVPQENLNLRYKGLEAAREGKY
jgi:hypothetical protein